MHCSSSTQFGGEMSSVSKNRKGIVQGELSEGGGCPDSELSSAASSVSAAGHGLLPHCQKRYRKFVQAFVE